MELDHDLPLSPELARLGEELTHLVEGPSLEARARIMAAVRVAPALPPRRHPWRRRVLVLAGGFVLVGGGGTTALVASAEALPGSPAYGLRLAGERLRLSVAAPTAAEGLRLVFARDRLNQATVAASRGDGAVAVRLLGDSRAYLRGARDGMSDVSAGDRGRLQGELNDVQWEETTAGQLQQQGPPAPPTVVVPSQGPQPPQWTHPGDRGERGNGGASQTPAGAAPRDGSGAGDLHGTRPPSPALPTGDPSGTPVPNDDPRGHAE